MRKGFIFRALLMALAFTAILNCLPASSLAVAASVAPPEDTKLREEVKSIERSLGIQTELPRGTKMDLRPDTAANSAKDFTLEPKPFQLNLFKMILWAAILIAFGIVISAFTSGGRWSNSRSRKLTHKEAAIKEAQRTAVQLEKTQLEAEDLAQAGNYAEAMHLLLIQSLAELRRRLDISFAASLTSREILQRTRISPEGRAAFADIITRVEISYFGNHYPGRDEYLACLHSFGLFSEALQGYAANREDAV